MTALHIVRRIAAPPREVMAHLRRCFEGEGHREVVLRELSGQTAVLALAPVTDSDVEIIVRAETGGSSVLLARYSGAQLGALGTVALIGMLLAAALFVLGTGIVGPAGFILVVVGVWIELARRSRRSRDAERDFAAIAAAIDSIMLPLASGSPYRPELPAAPELPAGSTAPVVNPKHRYALAPQPAPPPPVPVPVPVRDPRPAALIPVDDPWQRHIDVAVAPEQVMASLREAYADTGHAPVIFSERGPFQCTLTGTASDARGLVPRVRIEVFKIDGGARLVVGWEVFEGQVLGVLCGALALFGMLMIPSATTVGAALVLAAPFVYGMFQQREDRAVAAFKQIVADLRVQLGAPHDPG